MKKQIELLSTEAKELVGAHPDQSALVDTLSALGIEGDQDWVNETTTWWLPDGSAVVMSSRWTWTLESTFNLRSIDVDTAI